MLCHNPRFVVCLVSALILLSCKKSTEPYDICIYGGTSAGVIAAYSAAKLGKHVILIEPGRHLGGLTAGGLGYTDIGNKYAITGLSRDFYRRIGGHYGTFEQWIFEPHVAEMIFNEYIREAEVEVLYAHRILRAHTDDGLIRSITLEHSDSASLHEETVISARMFIDCSYEGDLMAKAGVSYVVGREANSTYGETYNGVQLMTGHQFPDGVDPYVVPGDPASGLLWGISGDTLAARGTGDSKVQAYNYRICLTDDPANMVPIERPHDYDSTRYELLLRLFDAQPEKRKLNDYFILSHMPNRKTDINNRGGFSSDMIGMNHDYPEADYAARAESIRLHEAYTKGLLYFYGHDPRVPAALRNEMQQLGYPKDEYPDNGHWSHQLYVRECRRMNGSYVMTQANCEGREVVDDGIGLAAYTMDSHNCQRLVVNDMVKNEGNVEIGGFGPYPVSYRAIIPKAEECRNLFVPVCLSASHIAYGSIRMEPVFMVLAQSAAVGASLAMDHNRAVQDVDVSEIRRILKEDPLLDGSIPDVLVDNADSTHVRITGSWTRRTSEPEHGYTGNYGPDMLVSQMDGEEQEVKFIPVIAEPCEYAVYAYIPKIPRSSPQTHFLVFDGRDTTQVVIETAQVKVTGQTSGEWVALGTYELPRGQTAFVTVTGSGTEGHVVADAVLCVVQDGCTG